MRCPLCGGSTRRLFQHRDYWIHACETCGHRNAEITPAANHLDAIYGDQYFEGGQAGYTDYLSEADILLSRGRQYGRMLARYMPVGTVLDVGAAAGFVLKGYLEAGWRGRGIEPNSGMARYARTHLGLDVATGSLETFRSDALFDLVSMIQVIGHFIDPRSALQAADAVTRPGGFWLIESWNRESITARLFGKQWHEYSPPSVLHWFSPGGLSGLAREFGFHEVAHGRPGKWIGGAHAKSLLKYRLAGLPGQRLLRWAVDLAPDGMNIPYPAEDLFWILFQKRA